MKRSHDHLHEEVTYPHLATFLRSGGMLEVGEDFSLRAFARIRRRNKTILVDTVYRDFAAILKEMDSTAREYLSMFFYLSGLALLLALLTGADCVAATFLESPDGRIRLDIRIVEKGKHSRIAFKVSFEDRPVVAASTISFVRSDGAVIGDQLTVTSVDKPSTHREIWKPVYGERSTITDHFHQIAIDLHDASADCPMQLDFRCYNAGIAFRTVLGDQK